MALFMYPTEGPEAIAIELGKFLAYLHFAKGNKLSPAVGRLPAIQYFQRLGGIELPMKHHFLRALTFGMSRKSTFKGGRGTNLSAFDIGHAALGP